MNPYWMMTAKDDDSAEILLYDQIGEGFFSEGMGAKQFAKDLKALGAIKQLAVRINSPGGSVFEGTAIYNQLRSHKATKTVYIDGVAASIASMIAMAGDTIIMPENAMLMVHDPSGFVVGDAGAMRDMAETLDKIKLGMVAAYQRKTKLSSDLIHQIMTDETWMTAEEAVAQGFADHMSMPVRIAASFDLSHFHHAPGLRAITPTKELPMSAKETPTNMYDEAALCAAVATARAEAFEEGKKEGMMLGAHAECLRIQAVEAQFLPGHQLLIHALKYDGVTSGPDAAAKILEAERKARHVALDAFYAESPAPLPPVGEPKLEPVKVEDKIDLAIRTVMARDSVNYQTAAMTASREHPGLFRQR